MRSAAFALALNALALPFLCGPATAQSKTEIVDVEVRPGVTMRYLWTPAAGGATAAVILLAGGKGALKLSPAGDFGDLRLNFLIRSRDQFARHGLAVASLDAASDNLAGMNGKIRMSSEYAQDVGKVIAEVKKRTGVPVWVIGTSAGTLSAVNVGARSAPPARRHRAHVDDDDTRQRRLLRRDGLQRAPRLNQEARARRVA